jgi:hypothetical protein
MIIMVVTTEGDTGSAACSSTAIFDWWRCN